MKNILIAIAIFASTVCLGQTRGILIKHNFIKSDSSIISQLFEKIEVNILNKEKTIEVKCSFYPDSISARKNISRLYFGSDIIINDNLYRINYGGTSYTYITIPSDVYIDALNHCIEEILWLNKNVEMGIKSKEITLKHN